MDKHQNHKGETPYGRKFSIRKDGTLWLEPFKGKPAETHRVLPYQSHRLYLALIDGRGKTRYLYPQHRWHMLSSVMQGKQYVEILAATAEDGIGVIARWSRTIGSGPWKVEAIDTEGCEWAEITDWSQETVVTRTPPHLFDDNENYYQ